MRKSSIKSIAHWTIMSLLLLFPVLMVGVSNFASDSQEVVVNETYEYQTNELTSNADIVSGNIYFVNQHTLHTFDLNNVSIIVVKPVLDSGYVSYDGSLLNNSYSLNDNSIFTFEVSIDSYYDYYEIYLTEAFYFQVDDNIVLYNLYVKFIPLNPEDSMAFIDQNFYTYLSASDYLGEVTTDVQITNANYKQDVNNWINGFKNLPVNAWYSDLLNVIGIGDTTNSVMNVIYIYPLYVIWVYVIDLIVDCLLVLVHLPHKALNKLGGDNE